MDEIRLRINHSKRLWNNVMIFTETWLNSDISDNAIALAEHHTFRADRTADDSGKTRGGGLCIYVNKAWCMNSVIIGRHCSANLEFLMFKCRLFYLPREFTSTIITAAYIPPDADAKLAMNELHAAVSKQQNVHPEAAFIVVGDFNHSNLKTVLPKFHQNIFCHTRENKTLDHVYTNMAEAYIVTQACNTAFRSGDAQAYSTSRANLKRGIKKTKHCYKLKLEEHFSNSDPRHMWQGIQALSDYKPSQSTPTDTNVFFLNELNDFYARFERDNKETATKIASSTNHSPISFTFSEVYTALSQINARKAAGPDDIPGRVLRACAEQLAGVFTDIFNMSLAQAAVPACFKSTSIVPVPKHSSPTCLNDYRPVALTPIIMKCFEQLVLTHRKDSLQPSLDPHQFAYRGNRSTDDAVSIALHSVLTHLDNTNTYARMLFVDFSSAFNTVLPSKLITKLRDLDINTSICNWIMDFLTNRPQHVRSGHICSTTITLNTGVPQGCVLSPFLYSVFTHDCRPVYGSNTIIEFADDTTVIGLISNIDETAYREEIKHLATWCTDNNPLLNTNKTKELIVDFRKGRRGSHEPIHINGMAVEPVSSFKFLGTHISEDLSWTTNTSSLVNKAHQRLFFLRTQLSLAILVNFYRCTIESILTNCVTVWYGSCSVAERKALQQVVKTAQRIIGTPLPAIEDIQKKHCMRGARSILKDDSHPAHKLFSLLQVSQVKNQQTEEQLLSQSCLLIELCPPLTP
ncbi:RNA-directed DNA polymerase from mobile element jockey [Labeo rohita]|uniref:RNA-directed DNA polymerase from mobile element jockey n=1 Tax=Labeo rohita TaxID=84645 RepID=A0ABQ8L4Q2_LABRO|nr:RNA-directed DNA polymerase from mobile element jockey [Labeo rohita]